jgi:hypothetical protein
MSSKEFLLMRDVICEYHPSFLESKKLRKFGLEQPELFKVEKLVEQCMASIGGYDYIDAAHADFSDGSDSKTASISYNPIKTKAKHHIHYIGEINNVSKVSGSEKSGALRCVIYNPHKEDLRYYFLPKSMWMNNIRIHKSSGIGRIQYTYNVVKNIIPKFEGFECLDFEDLAYAR